MMLCTGMLSDFVDELIAAYNSETTEEIRWQYYLHRVFDMSFQEFVSECETESGRADDSVNLSETINDSFDMMNNFILE